MRIEIDRYLGVNWPEAMGPNTEPVFEELIRRLRRAA